MREGDFRWAIPDPCAGAGPERLGGWEGCRPLVDGAQGQQHYLCRAIPGPCAGSQPEHLGMREFRRVLVLPLGYCLLPGFMRTTGFIRRLLIPSTATRLTWWARVGLVPFVFAMWSKCGSKMMCLNKEDYEVQFEGPLCEKGGGWTATSNTE